VNARRITLATSAVLLSIAACDPAVRTIGVTVPVAPPTAVARATMPVQPVAPKEREEFAGVNRVFEARRNKLADQLDELGTLLGRPIDPNFPKAALAHLEAVDVKYAEILLAADECELALARLEKVGGLQEGTQGLLESIRTLRRNAKEHLKETANIRRLMKGR
jgi:hypothetical protein